MIARVAAILVVLFAVAYATDEVLNRLVSESVHRTIATVLVVVLYGVYRYGTRRSQEEKVQ